MKHRLDIFPYFHNQKYKCWHKFFLNFVNFSNFLMIFYVFDIKFSSETFVVFPNSGRISVYRMWISNKTPFETFVVIFCILNINQTFSWMIYLFWQFNMSATTYKLLFWNFNILFYRLINSPTQAFCLIFFFLFLS